MCISFARCPASAGSRPAFDPFPGKDPGTAPEAIWDSEDF